MKRVLLVLAAFAAACSSSSDVHRVQDKQPAPERDPLVATAGSDQVAPVPVDQVVRPALKRIGAAAWRDADSFTAVERVDLSDRIAALREIADVRPAPGETAEQRAEREWRAKIAVERIQLLTTLEQESALRAATSVYLARVELATDYDQLRTLAVHAGLPSDAVPSEPLRLLSNEELARIDQRWRATEKQLHELQARAPPGRYRHALAEAEKARARVHAAMAQPVVDLVEQLQRAPRLDRVQDAAWVAEQVGARDELIRKREANLLQEALAKDGSDVQAAARLLEIDHSADALRTGLRVTSLVRFRASTPSRRVVDLIKDRVADPSRAAWNEAVLRAQWHLDKAGLPPGTTFQQWVVSHLTDGDLVEAHGWLRQTRQRVAEIGAAIPDVLRRRDFDLKQLDWDATAVEAELVARRAGQSPLVTTPSPNLAPWPYEPPATPADVPPMLQRYYWHALQELSARTELRPDVVRVMDEYALEGYKRQIVELGKHAHRLAGLRSQIRQTVSSGIDPVLATAVDLVHVDIGGMFDSAGKLIITSPEDLVDAYADRIRTGLRGLHLEPAVLAPVEHALSRAVRYVSSGILPYDRLRRRVMLYEGERDGLLRYHAERDSAPPRPFGDPAIRELDTRISSSLKPLQRQAAVVEQAANTRAASERARIEREIKIEREIRERSERSVLDEILEHPSK